MEGILPLGERRGEGGHERAIEPGRGLSCLALNLTTEVKQEEGRNVSQDTCGCDEVTLRREEALLPSDSV